MRAITRAAADLGIEYLTLYSFSSENWGRPAEEVSDLMGLLRQFVKRDLDELVKNGVEVHVIGERASLSPDIAALVEEAEARTRGLKKLKLLVAFNYGGRDEIVGAARALARETWRLVAFRPKKSPSRSSRAIFIPRAFPIPISSSARAASSA